MRSSSDRYSNSGSREKLFENIFFEPVWRGKLFQMKVWVAAIDSVKFSPKSELSLRFFGRLKFFVLFEYLGLKNIFGFWKQTLHKSSTKFNQNFNEIDTDATAAGAAAAAPVFTAVFAMVSREAAAEAAAAPAAAAAAAAAAASVSEWKTNFASIQFCFNWFRFRFF